MLISIAVFVFEECYPKEDIFLVVFKISLQLICACMYVSFLAYALEAQKNLVDCTDGTLFEQKGPVYKACQFPVTLLEECSGVNDPSFGYSSGHPCVLVKMNRVCTCFAAVAAFS